MSTDSPTPIIGWREWVVLPGLGVEFIKAKIDTGARTSALHAYDIQIARRDDGRDWVRFKIHPMQRRRRPTITAEAPLLEYRHIRSSTGHEQLRPVILTEVIAVGERFEIELTLVKRDAMGFRMLLGREAVRGRFLVNPGRSYRGPRPTREQLKAAKMTRPKKSKKVQPKDPS